MHKNNAIAPFSLHRGNESSWIGRRGKKMTKKLVILLANKQFKDKGEREKGEKYVPVWPLLTRWV